MPSTAAWQAPSVVEKYNIHIVRPEKIKEWKMVAFFRVIKRFFWQLYESYGNWRKDDASVLAAATSYYMSLSFFPLLLILLSILGFLLRYSNWGIDAQQRLLKLLAESTAPSLATQVDVALSSVGSSAALNGPLGIITLLLASMVVFAHVEKAFDRVWNIPAKEYSGIFTAIGHILWQRLRAFLFLLSVWFLVIAAFIFNMSLEAMQTFTSTHVTLSPVVWHLITAGSGVGMNWFLFAILYKILPKAPVGWKEAIGGGLLASIIWEAGRRILAAIVIGSHYSVYGVVGAFIAIMLWVYYAAATILFGAEFVRVAGKNKSSPD
jgi:membrane protein